MIRRAGRDRARLPAASRLVKLFKWQAPQARSINQKRALRPELFLGPGQGSGSTALSIPCRKSHPASAYADCSQTPRAGTAWSRGTQTGTTSVLVRLLLYLRPGAAGTKGCKRRGGKQQKSIFSRFWRPEICSQGVAGLCSLCGLQGRVPPASSSSCGSRCPPTRDSISPTTALSS